MAYSLPEYNDRKYDLIAKIAWNFYTFALSRGAVGLDPISLNDTENVILKKIAYYVAATVDQ